MHEGEKNNPSVKHEHRWLHFRLRHKPHLNKHITVKFIKFSCIVRFVTLCRFFIPRLNLFIQKQSHRKSISSREKCLIIDEQWRVRWMRMTFQKSINFVLLQPSYLQSSQSRRWFDDLYFPIAWWNSLSRSIQRYLSLTTLLVAPFTTNIASRDFQSCEIPQKKGGLIQVIPPHHESVSPERIKTVLCVKNERTWATDGGSPASIGPLAPGRPKTPGPTASSGSTRTGNTWDRSSIHFRQVW